MDQRSQFVVQVIIPGFTTTHPARRLSIQRRSPTSSNTIRRPILSGRRAGVRRGLRGRATTSTCPTAPRRRRRRGHRTRAQRPFPFGVGVVPLVHTENFNASSSPTTRAAWKRLLDLVGEGAQLVGERGHGAASIATPRYIAWSGTAMLTREPEATADVAPCPRLRELDRPGAVRVVRRCLAEHPLGDGDYPGVRSVSLETRGAVLAARLEPDLVPDVALQDGQHAVRSSSSLNGGASSGPHSSTNSPGRWSARRSRSYRSSRRPMRRRRLRRDLEISLDRLRSSLRSPASSSSLAARLAVSAHAEHTDRPLATVHAPESTSARSVAGSRAYRLARDSRCRAVRSVTPTWAATSAMVAD